MGLPDIYYPPPGPEGWREFWFMHFQDHLEIMQALQTKKNIKLTEYLIDPWIDSDKEGILARHQQYHDDFNQQLTLNGNDLSSVDFQKQNEVQAWTYLNYQEHYAARAALGI